MTDAVHQRVEGRGGRLADYVPLIALVLVALAAALAIVQGFGGGLREGMHAYMGVFLTVFALLKIFDLEGFADGFHMYDLAARHVSRKWGYAYPFVELALALAYFGFAAPVAVYWATLLVFLFGAAGVLLALRRGLDIDCPCMGNVLSVPLSTVTLVEDLGMAAMAAILLLM
jgi:hypothetical protein